MKRELSGRIFLQRWLVIFLSVVGFLGAVIAIIPLHLGFFNGMLLVLISAAFSAIIAYVNLPARQILPDDIVPIETASKKISKIHYPTDKVLVKRANDLAIHIFGDDTVSYQVYEQWRAKNPYIITTLTDRRGEFAGYFDVVPLKPKFVRGLREGYLGENDIEADCIYDKYEMDRAKSIYFAGIAVTNPRESSGKINAAVLIWAAIKYLERNYDLKKGLKVFSIPATQDGKRLLERLGFKICGFPSDRRDNHYLYSLTLTQNKIEPLGALYSRINAMCDYSDYDRIKKFRQKPS